MPKRSYSSAAGYRYGFNGKENDNDVKGLGNQQDFGMRIYDPRIGKFLSVDPLTTSYPWYTPYQFAGNKPIWAIDLDGMEEYIANMENTCVLCDIFNTGVTGLENVVTRGLEYAVTDKKEGKYIRKVLVSQGFQVSALIDNKTLGKNFKIVWENRTAYVEPEKGIVSDLLDIGIGALQVSSVISPGTAGGGMIGMSISPLVKTTVGDILKSLKIAARKDDILKNWLDVATKKPIKEFEAESAAILEETMGLQLRAGKEGADYIVQSGGINGKSVIGKSMDQIGIPKEAMGKFKMSDLFSSIDAHFRKSVDFIVLDMRHLNTTQQKEVMAYVEKNYADKLDKLITIGLNK